MNDLRMFLKICEGCGVLWLRTGASDGVYCHRCATKLADFPQPNPGKCRNHRIRMAGERAARQRRPRCTVSRKFQIATQTAIQTEAQAASRSGTNRSAGGVA